MTLFPTPPVLTEKEWSKQLVYVGETLGYATNHVYPLQTQKQGWRTSTTAKGWPDLMMVRGPVLIVIEAKGVKTPTTMEQIEWLHRFSHIPGVWAWLLRVGDVGLQQVADWLARPDDAPRTHGWSIPPGRGARR